MRTDNTKYTLALWEKIKDPVVYKAFSELVGKLIRAFADIQADIKALYAAIAALASGDGGLPSGMIVFFLAAACPTGWTEETTLRGRFPRGMDDPATDTPGFQGGSETHNHGGDTGENRAAAYNISFAAGGTTQSLARHNHDHNMSSDSHVPPYVDGIWCKKD